MYCVWRESRAAKEQKLNFKNVIIGAVSAEIVANIWRSIKVYICLADPTSKKLDKLADDMKQLCESVEEDMKALHLKADESNKVLKKIVGLVCFHLKCFHANIPLVD